MRQKPSRIGMVLRTAGAILVLLLAGGAAFTGAYYLTGWIVGKYGIALNDFFVQLLNWGIGFLLLFLLGFMFNLIARPKQMHVWNEMLDALRRIAKGDFNVRIDQEGKYRGQFGEFVDSINSMTQELKQVEKLRGQFISDVSHEIQSPLTSIRGFANTLKREDLSLEERRHYLSIIEKETVRLSSLSDNLMKLTSLQSEQVEWEMKPFRLDRQLEHVILSCEPQWLDKRLDVELEASFCEVEGNEEPMSQVWLNLLHNAIKFTPEGGTISIALHQTGEEVVLSVSDSGIGIPPEDQLRIFERFFKGDKQRTRTAEGSGLGLSIVHRIVELHRGHIDVRSKPGEGTTFEVSLPKRPMKP